MSGRFDTTCRDRGEHKGCGKPITLVKEKDGWKAYDKGTTTQHKHESTTQQITIAERKPATIDLGYLHKQPEQVAAPDESIIAAMKNIYKLANIVGAELGLLTDNMEPKDAKITRLALMKMLVQLWRKT